VIQCTTIPWDQTIGCARRTAGTGTNADPLGLIEPDRDPIDQKITAARGELAVNPGPHRSWRRRARQAGRNALHAAARYYSVSAGPPVAERQPACWRFAPQSLRLIYEEFFAARPAAPRLCEKLVPFRYKQSGPRRQARLDRLDSLVVIGRICPSILPAVSKLPAPRPSILLRARLGH
jgi:hypothetical protein